MKEESRIEFLVTIYNIETLIDEIWQYLDEIERQRSIRNSRVQ